MTLKPNPMRTKEFLNRYESAKKDILVNQTSLTKAGKKYQINRQTLSRCLKEEGYKVTNRQNQTKFNEHVFDIIDSEEKAYWLGFLYADGAISKDRNTIELSLKASDFEHLEKFKKFLEFNNEKHIYVDEIRCRLAVSNKHLKEQLVLLGCPPQKSLKLTFPSCQQVPNNLISHFIRGYIDGDGSIMFNTKHTCGRLNVLGTKNMILGIIQNMHWKQNAIRTKGGIYMVEWCGHYVKSYLDCLYKNATIYLDRKFEKYLQIKALYLPS